MYHTTPCPAVAPNSEISTRFRFAHCVNASFSGFADVMPALLMCWKIGDSFIRSRMYSEIADEQNRDQKGNAPAPGAERLRAHRSSARCRITAKETNSPSVAVIWMKLV